jgi:hypothetical protein
MTTRTFPEIGDNPSATDHFYTDDGEPRNCYNARVRVNGTEVPAVTASSMRDDEYAIETQIRTDGPASVTRLSDIYVPAYWNGDDIFDSLPLQPDSRINVPVTIETRPPQQSGYERNWRTVHYGWLRKIGSGGEGRLLRFKVSDYANIANNTPVTEHWHDVPHNEFFNYAVDRLREKDSFPAFSIGTVNEDVIAEGTTYGSEAEDSYGYIGEYEVDAANGDTVATMFDKLAEVTETDWWFEPSGDGLVLMFVSLDDVYKGWKSRESGGTLRVRDNRALYSLDPINTVVVVGEEITSVEGRSNRSGSYISAKASHDKLLEHADGQENSKVIYGSYSDMKSAENTAREKLIKEIRSGGEGEIITDGHPELFIGNAVTSRPLCGNLISSDVPPLDYGVKGLSHQVPSDGRYKTKLSVGIHAPSNGVSSSYGYSSKQGDIFIPTTGQITRTFSEVGE